MNPQSSSASVPNPEFQTSKPKVYLIDGSGYIFRAYYAVQSLSNSQGFPTNALFGFSRMVVKLLKQRGAEHVVMVFDAGRETFRNALYPEYKANRSEAPEDLVPQFPYFREISKAVGIKALELPGYEADDIIGTLARRLYKAGHPVVVVSGDKDLMQLVTPEGAHPTIEIWDPMKDRHVGPAEVREKFGVGPEQVIEVMGLIGDASDNIPGLSGVGPKTATQLIEKFHTIEQLLADPKAIEKDVTIRNRKKIAEQLELNGDLLRLSRQLVEIDCCAPVVLPLNGANDSLAAGEGVGAGESGLITEMSDAQLFDALSRRRPDRVRVTELFSRFQFDNLLKDMESLYGCGEFAEQISFKAVTQSSETTSETTSETSLVSEEHSKGDRQGGFNFATPASVRSTQDIESTPEQDLPDSPTDPKYRTVFSDQFEQFLAELAKQQAFAFDLETTSLDPLSAKIVGASFCWCDSSKPWAEHEAFYLPIGHAEIAVPTGAEQISLESFLQRVGPIFIDPKIGKIGQNLKYDISVIAAQQIDRGEPIIVGGVTFDCMLASYLLHPDRNSHGLTVLAREVLGREVIEYTEVIAGYASFAEVPVQKARRYACQDAHFAWLIAQKLQEALSQQELLNLFNTVEVPLVRVLSQMENAGVLLDVGLLNELSLQLDARLIELHNQIIELCGEEFNINSPKQLAHILFDKLGLSTRGLKKTKTGFSTDADTLERLKDQHPAPKLLLEYRGCAKLKNTYVDVLPGLVSARTGRLHSRFNQTVTGTGRLSSSDPNLQNIPIQTELGRRIRAAFIAPPGCVLIAADYSQIELRILAHLSGDRTLIKAFQDGADIHSATAREILDLPDHQPITPEQRRLGKTINFGIVYGMGATRLARELEIPFSTAQHYIDSYFARYPNVRQFFDRMENSAVQDGFVKTIFGRKRFIESIDPSGRDRGFVMRAALNAPLQGSAADIVKLAMIKIDHEIATKKLPLRLLIQVHDELVFECESSAASEVAEIVRATMEDVCELSAPLKVDVGMGKNWQDAH